MEKSETHRRDLSNTVEELMLICDTSEKELNKLVCVGQVSRWYLTIWALETVTAVLSRHRPVTLATRTPWWTTTS